MLKPRHLSSGVAIQVERREQPLQAVQPLRRRNCDICQDKLLVVVPPNEKGMNAGQEEGGATAATERKPDEARSTTREHSSERNGQEA